MTVAEHSVHGKKTQSNRNAFVLRIFNIFLVGGDFCQ